MNQIEVVLIELDEAKKHVLKAKKLLKSSSLNYQKSALALIFLIQQSILSVLEIDNDECTEFLYEKCLADDEDLTYMVHNLIQYEYTTSAQCMIDRYKRIVDALIVYYTEGVEAFLEIDDTIEESNEDGPEDPIGFVTIEYSIRTLQELIMDFYSLRNTLKDKVIEDVTLRRSMAIDIVALRESLWKVITEVCVVRHYDEDHMINKFCQEMGVDLMHISGIIVDFEIDGKSDVGILLLDKMIDMAKRFMNFCTTENKDHLQGDFILLDTNDLIDFLFDDEDEEGTD